MHPKVTTALRWMGQTPVQMLMLEVYIATWWCVVSVLVRPNSQPQGDTIPTLESSSVVDLGVAGLLLPGSPSLLSPPIN
jgi:hypothetical protein